MRLAVNVALVVIDELMLAVALGVTLVLDVTEALKYKQGLSAGATDAFRRAHGFMSAPVFEKLTTLLAFAAQRVPFPAAHRKFDGIR